MYLFFRKNANNTENQAGNKLLAIPLAVNGKAGEPIYTYSDFCRMAFSIVALEGNR